MAQSAARSCRPCAAFVALSMAIVGCGKSSAQTPAGVASAGAATGAATGVKLSKYDAEVFSPQIAVGGDGTIHVAYVERQATSPFAYFVFYRSSKDGGATWSETKNLSEEMAGIPVGRCDLLIDGKNRVYVVWRTGLKEQFPVTGTPAGGQEENLVFRAMDGGKWSKIEPVSKPGSPVTQDDAVMGSAACVDANGVAHVYWNVNPDRFHPTEVLSGGRPTGQHCNGIGAGLIFEATLDGSTATPKEFYSAPVTTDPAEPVYGKSCDELMVIGAVADAKGPHLIARLRKFNVSGFDDKIHLAMIEGGKHEPLFDLPGSYLDLNTNPPTLLTDAKGKRHAIVFNTAGERASIQDMALSGDDEPTKLMSATPPGTIMGFEAAQGPNGKMAVLIQTTERGYNDAGDTWLTTSDGGEWTAPRCLTGNATKAHFQAKDTGALSGVATGEVYGPGRGAIAFDKAGNPLLALINVRTGSFGQSVGGVVYASGSSSNPMLFFVKP